MSLKRNLRSLNVKSSFITLVSIVGVLAYSSIVAADTFNGPKKLSAQEYKDLNINGPADLAEIKTDSLTINGPLNFNQLKVRGNTEISGPTSGENGEFKNIVVHGSFWGSKINIANLQVDGDVTIEDFKISGNVTINGPLKAKNGSFNDINTVYTPVALYNVIVNNINIKNKNNNGSSDENANGDNDKNNEIKLAGNTTVSGDITFESGNGVVFIRDKTAQLKGKIIGGKLKEE